MPNFADRLRATRESRGYSQTRLAELTGLQPSAISHFETGRRSPSFDNLRRLADALGVTTDYLLGRAELPAESGPEAQEFFRDFSQLTEENRRQLINFKEFLKRKDDEKRPGKPGSEEQP